MIYHYRAGVIIPFAQKYYKQLVLVVAAGFMATFAMMGAITRAAEITTGSLNAENFNSTDISTDGYAGISVGFNTAGFSNIVAVDVELTRADGSSVVKSANQGVIDLVNLPGPTQLTTPFVIVEGTFTEAGDVLYWDPAPAIWDPATVPTSVTITLTDNNGDTKSVTNSTFNQGAPSWPTYESLIDLIPDTTAPTADLVFPSIGFGAISFQVEFSESVVEAEAEDPANYFLNNWPAYAFTSGNLVGDATIEYDDATKTATVTFTNGGWYVSPEQEWGVENVKDLAGNSIVDTYETSTPMVDPEAPGVPTTTTPTLSSAQAWNWVAAVDPGGVEASGVAYYELRVDGGSWVNVGNVLTYNTSFTNDTHTVEVRAVDNAGNVGEPSTGTVTVFGDKEYCKVGGWSLLGTTFKNQGDCVSFFATGGRNLPAGETAPVPTNTRRR